MRVSAFVGSIVAPALGAHAVVNASNPELGLGSGVSGAIREACGGAGFQRLVREAWEREVGEPLGAEECLVTDAGSCEAFRWVLHVAAVDYRKRDAETGGSSGPRRVRSCMSSALQDADSLARKHGLESVFVLGVPLLGAGHGGLDEVTSVDAMMQAIKEGAGECRAVAQVRFAVLTSALAVLVRHAADRYGIAWSDT